ncbi:GIY-YIG nuclease family protein [Streptomyces sp. NBC_00654]|uniref:GIY-YIG nuclease family protein n=1 Tax=Streptomyces sp. NBC_00654 TaxID=2975799 RepID=UPI002257D2D9|nr:GIY-YIG nuclease family protein [Streptomyces sp. NBC_00654]MCX4967057.1 GIY-YIG nuclease family protein [Streptomyces sp. NBC_00654]
MTTSTPGGDSYVYVIGSAGSSRVKIGTSVCPEKRLKELQTGNPDRLDVLWYTPGGRELEAQLHQAFADQRVEGEWFDFGDVQPVGAIPAAVHQHAGITPRAGRPTARTAPRGSGARTGRGEQITPERLAGIVREGVLSVVPDVVRAVVRPEPEPVKDDDQERVPVRRKRVDGDLNRLMAFLFGPLAAQHALRTAAGKRGLAALGGWPSLVGFAVLAVVAMPVTAFLILRVITRDIWPVRKLPLLAGLAFILWDLFGFDKVIRDLVLARLPLEDIETFARTYFTQPAVTSAWALALFSFAMCLAGYDEQLKGHTDEQRAKDEAKLRKTARPPLVGSTQLPAAPAAKSVSARPSTGQMPPPPSIADLPPGIPRQPPAKNP